MHSRQIDNSAYFGLSINTHPNIQGVTRKGQVAREPMGLDFSIVIFVGAETLIKRISI